MTDSEIKKKVFEELEKCFPDMKKQDADVYTGSSLHLQTIASEAIDLTIKTCRAEWEKKKRS
jgi:hypothetical protein